MKTIRSLPALTPAQVTDFQEVVWTHFRAQSRDMPWRRVPSPYYVLVSEFMLQQTQVSRVVPKFLAFIDRFPTIESLAVASLGEVLRLWSGLGYNRRAKFLWEAARRVMDQHGGQLPATRGALRELPGIGPNTAGAILAYAYQQPVVFIETNIRTVYFHHFYADHPDAVGDGELTGLVEQTLDRDNPREWYWALMDYGSHLKKTGGGRLSQSRHYRKQSPLKGSPREMRGWIIRALTAGELTERELRTAVSADERYPGALAALEREGLVKHLPHGRYGLTAASDDR